MRLTLLDGTETLAPEELDELVVTGPEREAQRSRLTGSTLLFSLEDRPLALAAFSHLNGEFTVSECALQRRLKGDDELAELVIDGIETVALAAGANRLVIFSSSRVVRRAVRTIGYVPRGSAERTGFERRLTRAHAANN
jgi:hypothetical protein